MAGFMLLYIHRGMVNSEAPERYTLSETVVPGNPREMTRPLLADTNIFPSSTCPAVYLHINPKPSKVPLLFQRALNKL
jgi:hypothetical protein